MKIIERKEPVKLTFDSFEIKCNQKNRVPFKTDPVKPLGIYDCCESTILIDSVEDISIIGMGHDIEYDEYIVKCPVCNNYINITKQFKKSNNSHLIDFIKRI